MPSWLEKHVSKVLKRAHFEEAWVTDAEIRQRRNGDPKQVVLTLQTTEESNTARLIICIPRLR
jgi:hypothetical protein